MIRTMIFVGLSVLLFSATLMAQVPSLEDAKSLPVALQYATGAASDGYGQHMVTTENGTVKHYLIGNNGEEIAGYTQHVVAGGQFPAITSYGGKIRVTVKIGYQIVISQSLNGGVSWSSLPPYTPEDPPGIPVPIYDLDAFSDNNGTHITWATASTGSGNAEVYYVRFNDGVSAFTNFKNVTDLAQMQQGGRPKVVATPSEAHVQFVGSNLQMHSRDLDLSTGNWESNYIIDSVATSSSVSSTTIRVGNDDKVFCLIAQTPGQGSPEPQNFYLVNRLSSDQSWSTPQYVTTTTSGIGGGYMRNTIVASPTKAVTRFDSTIEMHALLNEP